MKLQVQKIKTGEQAGNVRLAEDGKELAVLTKEQAKSLADVLIAATK